MFCKKLQQLNAATERNILGFMTKKEPERKGGVRALCSVKILQLT